MDLIKNLRTKPPTYEDAVAAANEIERLRGALRVIDRIIPKDKSVVDMPVYAWTAGDIAEGALNGSWPAYGIMPELAKEPK